MAVKLKSRYRNQVLGKCQYEFETLLPEIGFFWKRYKGKGQLEKEDMDTTWKGSEDCERR